MSKRVSPSWAHKNVEFGEYWNRRLTHRLNRVAKAALGVSCLRELKRPIDLPTDPRLRAILDIVYPANGAGFLADPPHPDFPDFDIGRCFCCPDGELKPEHAKKGYLSS